MSTEIVKGLQDALQSCPGALTIFVTDFEGVIICSVGEEQRSRQSLVASQQGTIDQTGKLLMGKHRSSIYYYEKSQLVVLSAHPLTAYILAVPDANTGQLLKLRDKLDPLMQEIMLVIPTLPKARNA
ncbi:unnamed protein product [Auanema sp. JU1783]|nr:unnamed protein product [Auanema sp. JU1783]